MTKAFYYSRNAYENQSLLKTTHQAVFVFFIFEILPLVKKWKNVTLVIGDCNNAWISEAELNCVVCSRQANLQEEEQITYIVIPALNKF